MAATVNVLCPNGRRQNVRVSPNTRILEIIDTVCQKQKFNADHYNLKHKRTVLDVQVPFRYANLQNNAKLELVKSEKPRSQSGSTVVALQLPSGERLQHSFESSISLWQLLQHWEGQGNRPSLTCPPTDGDAIPHPVCIYMREEFIGEAWLRATTLKGLGLTGGKAIIRLLHRDVQLPPPPKASQPKADPQTNTISTPITTPASHVVASPSPVDTAMEHSTQENRDTVSTKQEMQSKTSSSIPPVKTAGSVPLCSQPNPSVIFTDSAMECSTLESRGDISPMDVDVSSDKSKRGEPDSQITKILQSAIDKSSDDNRDRNPSVRPKEKLQERTETDSGASTCNVKGHGAGGETAESVIGNIESSVGLNLDEYAKRRIQSLLEKEEEMVESMQTALMESIVHQRHTQPRQPEGTAMSTPRQSFANFKFPQSSSTSAECRDKGKEIAKHQSQVQPCDRYQLVFSQAQGLPLANNVEDVPDEFFDITVDDVRRMLSALRHQSAESDRELETRTMREAREQLQMRKYEKVVIRIHFPDHLILQGFFKPQETVEAVIKFVRANLSNKEQKFHLYTTPPKTVLKDLTQTLFKAKLFPAAVVYFGTQEPSDHYLSEDLLGDLASVLQAEAAVARNMNTGGLRRSLPTSSQASTSNPSSSPEGASGVADPSDPTSRGSVLTSASSQQKRQASPGSAVVSTKVPKWFKMGKK